MEYDIPSHHRALVVSSTTEDPEIKTLPTPQPSLGSAIVRVHEVGVISYLREIYNGERNYSFPKPLVPGCSAIGRIAAVGADACLLQTGQLVYVDCVVRGRDDPEAIFLSAIHEGGSDGSRKLMRDVWRDGTLAQFANVPLENCIPLDEARLCQGLGYSLDDLTYLSILLVPYGGLRDIAVEPGETIVVCPATGGYGGAGVQIAVAMGARVIAMGRNEKELARLKEHILKGTPSARLETVKITGDESTDTAALQVFGTIDAVLDFSPPEAANSTHLRSAIMALRRGGRCSLMGFNENFLAMWKIVGDDIGFKGKLMYEREDMVRFVKMLEGGMFPRGENFVRPKVFALEDWKEGFDAAAEYTGVGRMVVITP